MMLQRLRIYIFNLLLSASTFGNQSGSVLSHMKMIVDVINLKYIFLSRVMWY